MTALLLADHDGTRLTDATARALTAVRQLTDSVDVLVPAAPRAVAEQAATLEGIARLLSFDGTAASLRAEPIAATILSIAGRYDTFAAPATALGKAVMPRVAALLDVMQISDVVRITQPDCFARFIYAGTAIAHVRALDRLKVFTIRASAFPAAPAGAPPGPIELLEPPLDTHGSTHVRVERSISERPDLQTARVVVGGGRALASEKGFNDTLVPLAEALGAALAASRAAVDAGYAPSDTQVGQTGKVIAPELYIACGISGAIQHLAGIKDARTIVAINKDPDAPIFQVADIGLVGDLFEIVPELVRALGKPVP
jgi:electron transfer flavoprotein alpha subunit